MKVIVAGLPKTGTKSMTAALRQIGYQVYDFVEHFYFLEKEWDSIYQSKWTTGDLYRMYKDIDAAVDVPTSYFWEEISKAFPDVKIILTVRDNEDEWVKSLKFHFHLLDTHILARIVQVVEVLLKRKTGLLLNISYKHALNIDRALWARKTHLNESMLKMKYRAHNAHVMQNAPPGRLLVFNCKEGWSPLCQFLGVPTPDTPFPHKNIRASVVEETSKHPVGEIYKKELLVALTKLIAKIIVVCLALVFILTVFT